MPPEAIFLLEREVKLFFSTAVAAREAVVELGVAPAHARRLQDDSLYDTADETLRTQGCIIRIRTERWNDGSETTTLTVKGPVQPGEMKVREEHETRVENARALREAFRVLGLRPWFRYQKIREEFFKPDLVIAIDETPVGVYVELEGGADAIHAAASALGRAPGDFILDSYYRLYIKRRDELRLTSNDMVFPPSPEASADKR